MLAYPHEDSVLPESSHGDVDQFFIFVLLDNGNHLLRNKRFSLELECLVAVGVVKDHLIDLDRYGTHFFDQILLLLILSQSWREKDGIFLHHGIFIPEITCKKDGAHVTFEKDDCSPRNMFCIKEGKLYVNLLLLSDGQRIGLVVVIGINIL
jgi:hypothetical protein